MRISPEDYEANEFLNQYDDSENFEEEEGEAPNTDGCDGYKYWSMESYNHIVNTGCSHYSRGRAVDDPS